jgi:hypothetical protein
VKKMLKRAIQNGLDTLSQKKWFRLEGNVLCIVALVIAKYGIGLTWWQVFLGCVAYGFWDTGAELLKSYTQKPPFHRYQFRIGITNLADALVDAGIYSKDEIAQHASELYKTLGNTSTGYITFTWLEADLFYMNTTGFFSDHPEWTIYLEPFGERAKTLDNLRHGMPDGIELRRGGSGYELVLIKSEHRAGWWHGKLPDDEGPTVTIISLPYEFFRNRQEPYGKDIIKAALWREKREREILERAGLEYWQDAEVPSAWDYRGKYADLHWWNI